MKRLLTVLLFLLYTVPAYATTWYVDAIAGSDSNTTNAAYPGVSGTGPFKTPWKISTFATAINPGDTVAFRAGPTEVYRPSNNQYNWIFQPGAGSAAFGGTATNPVFITSYGEGPPPVLDGADCIGAAVGNCANGPIVGGNAWTLYSGSIYRIPWTTKPYAVYIDSEAGWPTLRSASCNTGTCVSVPHGGTVEPSSFLPAWQSSHAYTAGDAVQNVGNWYTAGSTATSGTTAPTCFQTTCSDGTITWTFQGRSSADITSMVPGSWFLGAAYLYIWMPNGDSPASHSIEVSDAFRIVFINDTNATGGAYNGEIYDHIAIRHGCIGLSTFSGGGGNVPTSTIIFKNGIITQQGTGPVDTAEACNNTFLNGGAAAYQSTGFAILNSRISYASHGGITAQCQTGLVIRGNDVSFATHSNINFPISGSCVPTGTQIVGNIVHGAVQPVNGAVGGFIQGQPGGIYIEGPEATTNIVENLVYSMDDFAGCNAYGLVDGCAGIEVFGATGGTISQNIVDSVNTGFIAYNAPTNLKVLHNIVTVKPGPLSYAVDIHTTCTGCTFDHNDWFAGSQTNIGLINAVAKTFATWQTAGNDANGESVDPVGLLPPAWYWMVHRLIADGITPAAGGASSGGAISILGLPNVWTAQQNFTVGFINGCSGSATLSGGTATVTNSCISSSSKLDCKDTTSFNNVSCTPSNGSLSISGTGSDVISWVVIG